MTLRTIVDSATRAAFRAGGWFFRGRYQLIARAFGLRPEGDARSPRGTLFVEIDGLGYGHLKSAIEGGYMPFTRRLLRERGYAVHRWRCGLVADTPPIQSGLFYGSSDGVFGFYWWDRQRQRRVVGANPYDMQRVQADVAARSPGGGLLAGGSSYSNIMSGGAEYAVLTIAGANRHWFKPGGGLLRALAILALNPGKVVRFAFDACWELLQEMEDRAFVTAMDRPRVLEGAFPIVRLLLNVLAREIVTAGTRLDLLRGVPVIYACFIGYDIVGHHSGPMSRNSLRVLRGIDGAIRKLSETRSWTNRQYDLVILSDHGMTPCQPIAEAFDQDFDEWVEQWWRNGAQASPRFRRDRRRLRRRLQRRPRQRSPKWLGRIAGTVARYSAGWFRTWGRVGAWTLEIGSAGAIKLGERFLEDEGRTDAPRVAVINCGPLSQLWVRDVDRRQDLGAIEALCPGFLTALVDHPGVEMVIGRERGEIVVTGRGGTIALRPLREGDLDDLAAGDAAAIAQRAREVILRVEGTNPLLVFEEPDAAALQIAEFAAMDGCGDVICIAAAFHPETLRDATPGAIGERHVYSFEHQLGTHASIGGDQSYPFIIVPPGETLDVRGVVTARQMYPVLMRFAARARGRPPAPAAQEVGGDEIASIVPP